ncbi:hypothetical protein L249_3695 [Ophiocordyceps polyrhachis-furcata BCC 54312]|uniref:Proteasome maturation factor UMP1 n=1 Tax=Ophiocordyceps polyrhachis-furcata BCC 54312 TaxID=1330021 RepID=A0A367L4I8_9HYPO|nr:hypothetical protein L249_3695 [Ophiocordyceps polyrhachis-furcata BCC 54312]
MSMRIAPPSSHATTYNQTTTPAPSAPGIHDTLRAGLGPSSTSHSPSCSCGNENDESVSSHPLEARLRKWEATQHELRMASLRRTFGIAEPVRREMELKMVRKGDWRPAELRSGLPSVHEDILRGTDASLTWEDVFTGDETAAVVSFHQEMDKKLRVE